ncbi:ATP-binding protein [Hydrogenophaga sp.]|uniref:PAS domain-containing hybrid sensor histidine kinase/response regulator n=1 Tax=Hydrogenophaga sp. TaxID=1904254 RepID=UPI002609278B|nr:ATP-binding protein [Hydrogenophaga sp.]MCW5652422.1 PAS domain S-box protein [Hydrogenophaga sp.]
MNDPDLPRRREAEARARLAEKSTVREPLDALPPGALMLLVQEMRLHQIELEMQNEELRVTHAALDATREHYFDLYDLAPVAYFTVDGRGCIQQVNQVAANLLGLGFDELEDEPLSRFIFGEDYELFAAQQRELQEQGGMLRCEMRIVNSCGETIWVEMGAALQHDEDDQPRQRVVLIDITARRMAAQLRQQQERAEAERRAMSRFLSAASHDLRQPTHAMGLLIDQLKQLPGTPQTHVLVGRLDASVRTLEHMLNALLDLSRLEPDYVQASPTALPFARLVDQLRPLFPAEGIPTGVRLKFRPSHTWLFSDPALLQRALHNLIGNALRFTPRGTVLVCCRPLREGTHARIEVRDSGIGIAPHHHEAVFDEFFQVDNPERDRSKGLGLGLNIAKRSCELLGHPITLRSCLGHGSCFAITVPTAPMPHEMADQALPMAAWDVSQEPLTGLRILVIEDDAMACDALFDFIKTWKAIPQAAEGLEAARAQFAEGRIPDLIVSDYRLRGAENGIDTVLTLRELAGRDLPAVLITGDTDRAVAERARAAGMVLLYKPARPTALREALLSLR